MKGASFERGRGTSRKYGAKTVLFVCPKMACGCRALRVIGLYLQEVLLTAVCVCVSTGEKCRATYAYLVV